MSLPIPEQLTDFASFSLLSPTFRLLQYPDNPSPLLNWSHTDNFHVQLKAYTEDALRLTCLQVLGELPVLESENACN